MPKLVVWGTRIAATREMRDLFEGDQQVRAVALVRSRAAFARALIAAGLEHDSVATVSNHLAKWASETRNGPEVAAARVEGQVYLLSNNRSGGRAWPWPPDGEVSR